MRSGNCPKCRSTDIRVGPTRAMKLAIMNKFSISFLANAAPDRYVCVSCGHMEQYVAHPADRAAIAAKWPAVRV